MHKCDMQVKLTLGPQVNLLAAEPSVTCLSVHRRFVCMQVCRFYNPTAFKPPQTA